MDCGAGPTTGGSERDFDGVRVADGAGQHLAVGQAHPGRLADVAGDMPRPGGQVQVSLTTRPLPRLELEPRLGYGWLRADGRALYAESAHQLLARWHFSATQSLRAAGKTVAGATA